MVFDILASLAELAGFLGAVGGFHTVTDDQAWERVCRWLSRCACCGAQRLGHGDCRCER